VSRRPQGQDDEVNVTLLRPIADITNHTRDTGELLYNKEANDLVVLRLKGRLLNTFCVKLNIPTTPSLPGEKGGESLQ
jgi:hypothetical protein